MEKYQNETFSLITIKRLCREGETLQNTKDFTKFKDDFVRYISKTFQFQNIEL
jgi:hypothetical protein